METGLETSTDELQPPASGTVQSGLPGLALLSIVTGAGTGLVVGCFRLALERGELYRNALISWAHQIPLLGFVLVVLATAGATAFAVWLVRRSGQPAAGSGIPHVEAVMDRELPAAPLLLLPVKFVGGLLAISAGLALGREGPSVQMGANLGSTWARILKRPEADQLALVAAGAGAGLAVAFNAPIAGTVFVFEELARRFDTRIAVAALGASSAAIAVAQLLIGQQPDFNLPALPYADPWSGPLFALLGLCAGFAGMVYNRVILGSCDLADRFTCLRPELRGAFIGAMVGALAWFAPKLVGGGDGLTLEVLTGKAVMIVLPLVLLLRFFLGPVSYAAGAPGGLFAPMLVVGAQLGLAFGFLSQLTIGDSGATPIAFAVVGMAAFFTAVVRAPVTGIILSIELTASFNLFLPMLWACFAAMAVPTLLQSPPIYDSLKERMIHLAPALRK